MDLQVGIEGTSESVGLGFRPLIEVGLFGFPENEVSGVGLFGIWVLG